MFLPNFDPLKGAVDILVVTESENPTRQEELRVMAVLEDTSSPVRNKYLEKLFDSVISKGHIDFDDIPNSRGNIVEYSGYTNMIEVLENIMKKCLKGKNGRYEAYEIGLPTNEGVLLPCGNSAFFIGEN